LRTEWNESTNERSRIVGSARTFHPTGNPTTIRDRATVDVVAWFTG